MDSVTLGFIGAGRMAAAIVKGILQKQLLRPEQILCIGNSPTSESAHKLAKETGIRIATNEQELATQSTHLVLACKPAHFSTLKPEWAEWSRNKSFLSILAGIRIVGLQKRFPHTAGIIRTMPNTPSQVGAGVTAWCAENQVTTRDRAIWEQLLSSLGVAVEVHEQELDLVTALSGSGPAYFFEIVRLLEQAAQELGLAPEKAALLARHTFTGAAKLLHESNRAAETLRKEVTTPGGTTEAGLRVLENAGLGNILKETLIAASRRSEELSRAYE